MRAHQQPRESVERQDFSLRWELMAVSNDALWALLVLPKCSTVAVSMLGSPDEDATCRLLEDVLLLLLPAPVDSRADPCGSSVPPSWSAHSPELVVDMQVSRAPPFCKVPLNGRLRLCEAQPSESTSPMMLEVFHSPPAPQLVPVPISFLDLGTASRSSSLSEVCCASAPSAAFLAHLPQLPESQPLLLLPESPAPFSL